MYYRLRSIRRTILPDIRFGNFKKKFCSFFCTPCRACQLALGLLAGQTTATTYCTCLQNNVINKIKYYTTLKYHQYSYSGNPAMLFAYTVWQRQLPYCILYISLKAGWAGTRSFIRFVISIYKSVLKLIGSRSCVSNH